MRLPRLRIRSRFLFPFESVSAPGVTPATLHTIPLRFHPWLPQLFLANGFLSEGFPVLMNILGSGHKKPRRYWKGVSTLLTRKGLKQASIKTL